MATTIALGLLAWLATTLAPAGALAWLVTRLASRRRETNRTWLLVATTLGAAGGMSAFFLERLVLRVSGARDHLATAALLPLLAALGFIGPLEEGLKLLSVWPAFARRALVGTVPCILSATWASVAFVAARHAATLLTSGRPGMRELVALAVATPCQILLSGTWAYLLGRGARPATPGRGFFALWAGVAIAHGVIDHLLSLRAVAALVGALPLLVALGAVAWAARGELLGDALEDERPSLLPPTSLREVQRVLSRRERPASLVFVALGALVNQGALLVMLAAAIAIGRRAGVDFSAVDDADTLTVAPLALLGLAIVLSYPLAGFVLARASEIPTIIEPALAAALSILGILVLLGVAAPVALAFALACAPVALLLGCVGAWVGMAR